MEEEETQGKKGTKTGNKMPGTSKGKNTAHNRLMKTLNSWTSDTLCPRVCVCVFVTVSYSKRIDKESSNSVTTPRSHLLNYLQGVNPAH